MTSIEQQEPTDGLSVGPQVTEAEAFPPGLRNLSEDELEHIGVEVAHEIRCGGLAKSRWNSICAGSLLVMLRKERANRQQSEHAAVEAAVAELRKENERLSLIAKGAVGPGSQAEVCDIDRALVCGVQQWHNDNVIGGQPRGDWHYNVSPEAGARQVAIYRRAYSEHNDRLFAEIQDLRARLDAKDLAIQSLKGNL